MSSQRVQEGRRLEGTDRPVGGARVGPRVPQTTRFCGLTAGKEQPPEMLRRLWVEERPQQPRKHR